MKPEHEDMAHAAADAELSVEKLMIFGQGLSAPPTMDRASWMMLLPEIYFTWKKQGPRWCQKISQTSTAE